MHLSNAGLAVWVQALRGYARTQVLKGEWVPEELKDVLPIPSVKEQEAAEQGSAGPDMEMPGTPEPETKEPETKEPETKEPGRVYEGPAHRNGEKT